VAVELDAYPPAAISEGDVAILVLLELKAGAERIRRVKQVRAQTGNPGSSGDSGDDGGDAANLRLGDESTGESAADE
jgi:hypothetical protein